MEISLEGKNKPFPKWTLGLSLAFILLTPFIHKWLVLVPLGIEIYRICRYNEHVFMVDMALLVPFTSVFMIPDVGTAFAILILFGDIVYAFKIWSFRVSGVMISVLLLILYLLLRLQTDINTFLFMSGGLIFLFLMLSSANEEDAGNVSVGYLVGLIASSIYGLVFRGSPQLVHYISNDAIASMKYREMFRFSGLMADSNYYSVFLILGMALLLQMFVAKKIKFPVYFILTVCISYFGIMTYSKTFFVMFILIIVLTVYLLLKERKYFLTLFLMSIVFIVAVLALTGKISLFDVIISRLFTARSLDSFTTGRSVLAMKYLRHSFSSVFLMLFGEGIGAELFGRLGTHNLYLEILYYTGFIGLALYVFYMAALMSMMKRKSKNRSSIFGMLSLAALCIIFLSLQGIEFISTYVQFFIAVLAMLFLPQKKEKRQNKSISFKVTDL